jgi:transposase
VRKIKEVLRLKFELSVGLRAIPRSCSIGVGTAHEYLQRAEASGVTWPLKNDRDEDRLEAVLFGGLPRPRPAALPMPASPSFTSRAVLSTTDSAGAASKMPCCAKNTRLEKSCSSIRWRYYSNHNSRGGPVERVLLFVAVMGASSYSYAEATADEQLASWIDAHVRVCLSSFKVRLSSWPRTTIRLALRKPDPDLNPTYRYQEMAMHYGVALFRRQRINRGTRPRENRGLLLAERWIIAALRHRKFFSIEQLNQAIRELRDRINQRPCRKRKVHENRSSRAWIGRCSILFPPSLLISANGLPPA